MNKQRTIVGLDQLAEQIEQWATDRGIDKAEPRAQFLKVVEEVGEIAAAMARNKHDELVDAIGDVFVTLVVLSMQHGIGIEDAIQAAYNEIKNRKGKTVNGVFLRDVRINELKKSVHESLTIEQMISKLPTPERVGQRIYFPTGIDMATINDRFPSFINMQFIVNEEMKWVPYNESAK